VLQPSRSWRERSSSSLQQPLLSVEEAAAAAGDEEEGLPAWGGWRVWSPAGTCRRSTRP